MIPDTIGIFNASHVTTELIKALLYALRSTLSYPEKVIVVNELIYDNDNMLYIIICPAGLGSEKYIKPPKYYITYQLESLKVLEEREHYRNFLSGAICNWDYSRKNVEFLKSHNINSYYVPPGFTSSMTTLDILEGSYLYSDYCKDIDVLFLGWDIYERRKYIEDTLILNGLRVLFVSGLDIEGMKKAIRRSKICLNLHFMDNMTCFETIRLNILLSNQTCVVSEDIDDPEKEIYRDHIKIVPYNDIVQTCVKLIGDPETRKRLAISSYQWYSNQRTWTKIVDFNRLLQ